MKKRLFIGCLILVTTVTLITIQALGVAMGEVLFSEDFSRGMDDWWVEGGQKVWIEDGRLHVMADPDMKKGEQGFGVATVWCKKEFPADIQVEFDAHVVASTIDVNNINFFISYSDPSGKPLFDSREDRADSKYSRYHRLSGYIVTYLNSGTGKARFRIRHNPGFKLLGEAFGYECERGKTYHVVIRKKDNEISVAVDGKVWCKVINPNPEGAGLIGCRTYQTYLWWDNIKVTSL